MTPTAPIEIEAKTLEDAVKMACEKLGRPEEELEIEVLSEGSSGIFGLVGAKNVKISARPKHEKPEKPAAEPHEAREPEDSDPVLAEDAAEILRSILSHFNLTAEVAPRMEGQTAYLDVSTDNPGLLIGRKAQTLDAFQYIVGSMMSRRMARRVRVVVDVEGYRSRKKTQGPRRKRSGGPPRKEED